MKKQQSYQKTYILLAITLIYTVLVSFVDKKPIGPNGTSVGFSAINKVFLDLISYSSLWDKITDIMLLLAILTAGYFALMGVLQIVRDKKTFFEVDHVILALGVLYLILIVLYVLFDKIPFNYRPVLLPDEIELEASFPSTHTLMICTIMGSAIVAWSKIFMYEERVLRILKIAACAVIVIGVVGRVLAGVHWFTDIIAGLLFSATLISAYRDTLDKLG
ncbi:MAG: phosphatase PAP2 family protein [Butyrivibrio sp.]|nr:phosphatase PAP2 family protein [Butyrivibrio sp.]